MHDTEARKIAQFLGTDSEEDMISAFAFNTGRLIDHIITTRTNNLEEDYKNLQAKVLNWRHSLKRIEISSFSKEATADMLLRDYDDYFGISNEPPDGKE